MQGRTQRRLAAIVAADVAGYSRLMGMDEAGTLAALRAHRAELIDPAITEYGGRIVKTMGDGLLLEFPSVVDAVQCSVQVQIAMTARNSDIAEDRRIVFRVGINLGDIIIDGDDIHGDGINIAARLESLSEPGGICISRRVHEDVRDRLDVSFADAGERQLKNIAHPVQIWQWTPAAALNPTPGETLALPDKPSIAVLPFDNMSGDPEQEYFADGIAEDVITALSRFRSLFVIARNSSFTYKGSAVDITQVARDLGVRYVVEGSVRKAGSRVRISAQLIDAASGNHLWADRFDGNLDDIFDLQDQITEQIVVAVEPEILSQERDRARRKPPGSLDAWEYLQRGLAHFYRTTREEHEEAVRLFREAIALDSDFAAAHAYLGHALIASVIHGRAGDREGTMAAAREAAERAISLDPNEAVAHHVLGRVQVLFGEVDGAIREIKTAIAINANHGTAHFVLGFAHHYGAGEAERALPHYDIALRLSPRDPMRWTFLMLKASALRFLGRHSEAVESARQACQFPDCAAIAYMHLAACSAEAGLGNEARAAIETGLRLEPALSIEFIRQAFIAMHANTMNSLIDSLRKAGLPEE